MRNKNLLSIAREVIKLEKDSLIKLHSSIGKSFEKIIKTILNCKNGKVVISGVGKSGIIGKKISATFSSVGIPSFFCDPAQALHGDMGQIEKKDILIIFSYSGNTSELTNMLKYANRYRI